MTKISFEEKLNAARRVVDAGMSREESAKIAGVHPSTVGNWVYRYCAKGPDGLKNGGASYSGDFKIRVIESMLKNKLSCMQVAAKYGIKNQYTVNKWEKIYYAEGPDGLRKRKPRGISVKKYNND